MSLFLNFLNFEVWVKDFNFLPLIRIPCEKHVYTFRIMSIYLTRVSPFHCGAHGRCGSGRCRLWGWLSRSAAQNLSAVCG